MLTLLVFVMPLTSADQLISQAYAARLADYQTQQLFQEDDLVVADRAVSTAPYADLLLTSRLETIGEMAIHAGQQTNAFLPVMDMREPCAAFTSAPRVDWLTTVSINPTDAAYLCGVASLDPARAPAHAPALWENSGKHRIAMIGPEVAAIPGRSTGRPEIMPRRVKKFDPMAGQAVLGSLEGLLDVQGYDAHRGQLLPSSGAGASQPPFALRANLLPAAAAPVFGKQLATPACQVAVSPSMQPSPDAFAVVVGLTAEAELHPSHGPPILRNFPASFVARRFPSRTILGIDLSSARIFLSAADSSAVLHSPAFPNQIPHEVMS